MIEKIVYRKAYSMFVRPGTSDDFICDEAADYESLFINSNKQDTLLDIGACIGSVSKMAVEKGINVIAYEPEPDNYKMLQKNLSKFFITTIKAAVGTGHDDSFLKVGNDSFKAKHSVQDRLFRDGYTSISVVTADFKNELKKYEPTILKIDIEGGEYNLDLANLPKNIKALAMEFHLINNNHSDMFHLYNIVKNQFSFQTGDIPINSLNAFEETFKEKDSAFMSIFLRNT